MTVVRATCPDCGDIRTSADKLTLRYVANTIYDRAVYRFICPQCNKIVVKPAEVQIATLLASSGVNIEEYELPLELLERPAEDDAPVISDDDIIDICLEIERDEAGWLNK